MKIAIDIPDPKCGKFCSFRCVFLNSFVISDVCRIFGQLKRVKTPHKIYSLSYVHNDCWKAKL